MTKICKYCGQSFDTTTNRTTCYNCVENVNYICENCGTTITKPRYAILGKTKILCKKCATKNTNLRKYGCENVFAAEDIKKCIQKTNLERYGVPCTLQSSTVQNKGKVTCREKYGTDYFVQSKEHHEAYKKTILEKYGVEHFSQTEKYSKLCRKHLQYDDVFFDSKPELEFYKKCKELGYAITRTPCKLIYTYNNQTHYYFPDFEVNNRLVEIKGAHFRADDNTWICPFDSTKNELFEAKHKCALSNNVLIIYDIELENFNYSILEKKTIIF